MTQPVTGKRLAELCEQVYRKKKHPLHIVETGCLRSQDMKAQVTDGWSTLYLAQWVSDNHGSTFTSYDMDYQAIETCQKVLAHLADLVKFRMGDSIYHLGEEPIDFAYLDSADNLFHGLREFLEVEKVMRRPGVVVMDDYNTKASLAAQYAFGQGYTIRLDMGRLTVVELV